MRVGDLIARVGGEEFVFLADQPSADGQLTCDRIRRSVNDMSWPELSTELRDTEAVTTRPAEVG